MKMFSVAGVMLLLACQFLYRAYAMELCESQDYYNLANSTKCSIQYNKEDINSNPQNAMFEIMKNYPFEGKDAFAKLLQRKIELIDNYKTQQQGQKHTEKVTANLNKLENAKQALLAQLELINTATRDNWVSVRDQARTTLEEATISLREVE